MEEKVYFNVDFKAKEAVKKLGARWDPIQKKWYAPNKKIAKLLTKKNFIPQTEETEVRVDHTNESLCQKCYNWYPTDTMVKSTVCHCSACERCHKRLKYAAHVFFCECYGNTPFES